MSMYPFACDLAACHAANAVCCAACTEGLITRTHSHAPFSCPCCDVHVRRWMRWYWCELASAHKKSMDSFNAVKSSYLWWAVWRNGSALDFDSLRDVIQRFQFRVLIRSSIFFIYFAKNWAIFQNCFVQCFYILCRNKIFPHKNRQQNRVKPIYSECNR